MAGFDAVAERVIAPAQNPGSRGTIGHHDVDVTASPVWHGGGEPANTICVVAVDGFRVLHEGGADMSCEAFSHLPAPSIGLDLASLHTRIVLGDGREILTGILHRRAVVLVHHPWTHAAQTRGLLARLAPEFAAALPPVTVFSAGLESRSLGARSR